MKGLTKKQRLKFNIIISIIIFWLLYRILFLRSDDGLVNYLYCFKDRVLMEYLNDATLFLSQNLQYRDYLLITGSNMLDMVLPTYLLLFIFVGDSWQPVMNVALFYNVRGPLIQNLTGLQYYDTYLFDYPGFYSFSVPYFRAADFFYSGHAGCAILCAFQFKRYGYKFLFYFAIIVGFLEGFIMILLRTHYFIDVVFGMIAGHYFFMWSDLAAIPFNFIIPLNNTKNEEAVKSNQNKIKDH